MSANIDTVTGWAGIANNQPLVQKTMPLKKWDDDTVELDITHCGICGSDEYLLSESWGPTEYPVICGHEIVGKVTRVGANVTKLKIGDRAGVGAQADSCHQCKNCKEGNMNLCPKKQLTFMGQWPCGTRAMGGFADKWRGDHRFAFKIPDNLSSENAATFLCAGITSYAPLKRTNVGKDSIVGVMGIGGLGHYGILFARKMGAKVVGLSHNNEKRDVALEVGCDDYIITSDKQDMARYADTFTLILCTGSGPDFEWATYIDLIVANGYFINVSIPSWNFPGFNPFIFVFKQIYIHGSAIGSPAEIEDMLEFASKHKVKPWIDVFPMKDINKVFEDFKAGKPRFRYVLKN